ncbi:MAG: hypothetical protein DHS20C17_24910 [Cyclobacteriaceae bacterium]|nr:MAG: hypothetical protein DHS20C17_24910 [Cyclobacteriaceae bacterium]
MNTFDGVIHSIRTYGNLTLVKVAVADLIFTSIVIETPETAGYLKPGASTKVMFKSTEVIIANNPLGISLQNQIPAKVIEVIKGQLLCQLNLQYQQFTFGSIITRNAVEQLQIDAGSEVVAMIKTNEIMLSE